MPGSGEFFCSSVGHLLWVWVVEWILSTNNGIYSARSIVELLNGAITPTWNWTTSKHRQLVTLRARMVTQLVWCLSTESEFQISKLIARLKVKTTIQTCKLTIVWPLPFFHDYLCRRFWVLLLFKPLPSPRNPRTASHYSSMGVDVSASTAHGFVAFAWCRSWPYRGVCEDPNKRVSRLICTVPKEPAGLFNLTADIPIVLSSVRYSSDHRVGGRNRYLEKASKVLWIIP